MAIQAVGSAFTIIIIATKRIYTDRFNHTVSLLITVNNNCPTVVNGDLAIEIFLSKQCLRDRAKLKTACVIIY